MLLDDFIQSLGLRDVQMLHVLELSTRPSFEGFVLSLQRPILLVEAIVVLAFLEEVSGGAMDVSAGPIHVIKL